MSLTNPDEGQIPIRANWWGVSIACVLLAASSIFGLFLITAPVAAGSARSVSTILLALAGDILLIALTGIACRHSLMQAAATFTEMAVTQPRLLGGKKEILWRDVIRVRPEFSLVTESETIHVNPFLFRDRGLLFGTIARKVPATAQWDRRRWFEFT